MDFGSPPLKIKIMLESNPPKCRILVLRLAVPRSVKSSKPWDSCPDPGSFRAFGGLGPIARDPNSSHFDQSRLHAISIRRRSSHFETSRMEAFARLEGDPGQRERRLWGFEPLTLKSRGSNEYIIF